MPPLQTKCRWLVVERKKSERLAPRKTNTKHERFESIKVVVEHGTNTRTQDSFSSKKKMVMREVHPHTPPPPHTRVYVTT